MRKQLKTLNGKEFFFDVKQFIRNSHDFYRAKNPEIKTLAKRLHDEYELKDFYKVFNKLWKSGYHNERVLAVYALKLYSENYDKDTWRFLIPRLKEIKDYDEAERIGKIIGEILIKFPSLKREIKKISNRRNAYYRRIALASLFSVIPKKDFDFIFRIINERIHDKEENIQEIIGGLLQEVSRKNKTIVRRFILKNMDMSDLTFNLATKNLRDLKKVRKLKKLEDRRVKGFSWLKLVG